MATQEAAKLWFDITAFLDGVAAGQANTFELPPELYLRLGNAAGARFTFQCTALGPAAATANALKIELEATAALSDLVGVFWGIWNSTLIARGAKTIPFAIGIEGGEDEGYPGGVFRVKLTNSDVAANWASLRVRAWYQLIHA
jgi:hypothetical protein